MVYPSSDVCTIWVLLWCTAVVVSRPVKSHPLRDLSVCRWQKTLAEIASFFHSGSSSLNSSSFFIPFFVFRMPWLTPPHAQTHLTSLAVWQTSRALVNDFQSVGRHLCLRSRRPIKSSALSSTSYSASRTFW